MDINSLLQSGAQLFKDKLDTDRDGQIETTEIASALMSLLGNQQGQLDLSSIISSMQGGNSQDLMARWRHPGSVRVKTRRFPGISWNKSLATTKSPLSPSNWASAKLRR